MDKEKILTRLRGVVPQIFRFLESCSSELVGALDMSSNIFNQETCILLESANLLYSVTKLKV